MTVAAYVRVSTEQQKAEGSHENQRERIQQWAEPGGLRADFCDDHAEQKLAITDVSEITDRSVSSENEQEDSTDE